jgi:hypothetical protein
MRTGRLETLRDAGILSRRWRVLGRGSLVAAEGVSPSRLPRQGGLFFEELREVASQHSEPVKEDARLMAKSA